MQNPFLDAGQQYFKPFEQISQLQMEAGERLVKSQSALMSELFNQGMAYTETMMGKSSVDEYIKAQQTFFSDMGEKMRHMAEDSIDVWTDTNEKIVAILQQSMPSNLQAFSKDAAEMMTPATAKKTVTSATKKAAPAKKAAAETRKTTKKAVEKTAEAAKDVAEATEEAIK